MSSSEQRTMRLVARSENPFVEVVIVNHAFQRETSGFGTVEKELPPGVYRVDFKAGLSTQERYVVLDSESPADTVEVTFAADEVEFSSAVPLSQRNPDAASVRPPALVGTRAREWSRAPQTDLGAGSCIFFFAHGQHPAGSAGPLAGMTLHDAAGGVLLQLEESGEKDLAAAAAGSCISVDPGAYRLRCVLPDQTVMEQCVFACHAWSTQVFLHWKTRDEEAIPSTFPACSVLMSRVGQAFDPDSPALEWTEMAHVALASRRRSGMPDAIHEMLHEKFESPMLGILAGHLLVLSGRGEQEVVKIVADNLQRLVGPHPDVLALRLWLGEDPQEWSAVEVQAFRNPPMLRSSYGFIVESSVRYPQLIAPTSLTARIAGRLCGGGAWLTWEPPSPALKLGQVALAFPRIFSLLEGLTAQGKEASSEPASEDEKTAATLDLAWLKELAWKAWHTLPRLDQLQQYARDRGLTSLESALLEYVLRAINPYLSTEGIERAYTSDGRLRAQVVRPRLGSLFSPRALVDALGAPVGAIGIAGAGLMLKLGSDWLESGGTSEAPSPVIVDDTQKGRFGGKARRSGRRLSARVVGVPGNPDWFDVRVQVRSTVSKRPLAGSVQFFLHDTFRVPEIDVPVDRGTAVWEGRAWGAFTVGAVCDEGKTRLELDLSSLAGAPELFRTR